MVIFEEGDMFGNPDNVDIYAHQVNCQGKMGSGVALQVRRRFPKAYEDYVEMCEAADGGEHGRRMLLGTAALVLVSGRGEPRKYVCNLFSQYGYGYDGGLYTDYDALDRCLRQLSAEASGAMFGPLHPNAPIRIAIPYGMGCDRGGGDWDGAVFPELKDVFGGRRDILLTIYKLENNTDK